MILSLLRSTTSYFRPYRNYFLAIYTLFLAFPARELALFLGASPTQLVILTNVFVASAVSIAALWGYLTTALYFYPQPFSLKYLISEPGRPIYLGFLVYLIPIVTTLAASIVLPDAISRTPVNVDYLLSGQSPAVGYSSLFLTIAGTVMISFVSYPLAVLFSLRSQLKDEEIRRELLIIASCFGAVSVLLLAFSALTNFGLSMLGFAHIASVGLLFVVVRAFSRPTFLKAFLGVIPSLEKSPTASHLDQVVLIYKKGEAKFQAVSKFVGEAIGQGNEVIYFYGGDEVTIREGLSNNGASRLGEKLSKHFRLVQIAGLYGDYEIADADSAFASLPQLVSQARVNGREGLTIIIDYGERIGRATQKFVEHITDPRWTAENHYVKALMTLSNSLFEGQDEALSTLESRVNVVNLSESTDFLTRSMGLSHQGIVGKKILMKLDPLGDYERVLNSLIAEVTSNFERVAIFTRRDSALYSAIGEQRDLKMFVLTSRVSYPKIERENKVLLPAYDSSLLLDALNKTMEHYAGAALTIIFDSISHFIYTLGPERAYSLVRQALELIISDKITGVFLVNTEAHDDKVLSMFENLFDAELLCREGERAPEFRRKLSVAG